jgi:hypothetical protein
MKSRDRRLAFIGLVSLAIYVLACRPAFSPDGSKILVAASGGTNKQGHLLVYDRKVAKWTPLLTVAQSPGGNGAPIPTALWSADGKEVIAAWASDENEVMVSVLPVGGVGPTRLFQVDHLGEALPALVVPPVLIVRPGRSGSHLLFGGESITALNLESGETDQQKLAGNDATNAPKKTIYLVGQGKEVLYLLGGDKTLEAGRLDLESLRPSPLLQLKTEKEDGNPFLAVSKTSSRLALTRGNADNQSLLIYRQSQLERTLPFGATNNGIVLGNLVWSLDGKTLYAAGFRPLKPGPIAQAIHAGYQALRAAGFKPAEPTPLDLQVSVCEIPLAGKPLRETPLFRIASVDETFLMLYQIALSPDGKTIAASAGLSADDQGTRERDRALYLLDLSRAGRPVSKIPIPRATVVPAGVFPK